MQASLATADPRLVATAYTLLQQGRLGEAEAVCRNALAGAPRDGAAVHLLGLIRKEAGDLAGGERLMRESIALAPDRAEFRANLGNLLRRLGRLQEAETVYREALARDVRHRPSRFGLALTLHDLGRLTEAEAECSTLVRDNPRDAASWTVLGGVLRDQQRLPEAETAYRQALTAEPGYLLAHHNLGALLSQMERAEEALAALDRAAAGGLRGRELAFNRGRALLQLYRLDEAEAAFAEAVALDPSDCEAQLNLARLRYMRGDPAFARDIVAAAAASRDNARLQMLLADVLRRAGDLQSSEALLRDLIARFGPAPEFRSSLASVLHESGRLREAETEALEAAAALPDHPEVIEGLVVILLARGKAEDAMPFVRRQRMRQPNEQRWIAYEATSARLLGLDLYRELYDYDRLVQVYDLEPPPGWSSMEELNQALLRTLTERHRFNVHPLDQSLRYGSQTARSLIAEPDPVIQALLQAFAGPIATYMERVGTDPSHPLKSRNRGKARFVGCWSVQLRREGFHVNHVHPEGWISSAYYVSVPQEVRDDTLRSGWIKFGETRFPVPGATPERVVQPRAGRLVMFPSYMWHGTVPIHGPEPRTTVAFDAVPDDE